MKKNLLFFFFVLFLGTQSLIAQITINSTDFPSLGTMFVDANDTLPTNYNIGSPGANVTWDLTGLKNDSKDTTAVMSSAGTACAGNFANSGLSFSETDGLVYGTVSASGLNIDGFCQEGSTGYVPIVFNPSQKLFSFPSTYQTGFNGNSGFELKMPFGQSGIDSIRIKHNSNYSSMIDGWGSVSTPSFSNINCLRQKYTEYKNDSIYGYGITTGYQWVLIQNKMDTSVTYRWATNSSNFFLSEITKNFAEDSVVDASYLFSSSVGVQESQLMEKEIIIYPNPASDKLFISGISSQSYIVIFDVNGKLVEHSLLKKSKSAINVAGFENGIYFYQVSDLNGNLVSKGKFSVSK